MRYVYYCIHKIYIEDHVNIRGNVIFYNQFYKSIQVICRKLSTEFEFVIYKYR